MNPIDCIFMLVLGGWPKQANKIPDQFKIVSRFPMNIMVMVLLLPAVHPPSGMMMMIMMMITMVAK